MFTAAKSASGRILVVRLGSLGDIIHTLPAVASLKHSYPGWSLAVLKLLYEQRGITASGHETTDTDPGLATTRDDYSLESYVLGQNHFQIELLANLDQVPEAGGIVIVSFPKPADGAGFPARVIAIVP